MKNYVMDIIKGYVGLLLCAVIVMILLLITAPIIALGVKAIVNTFVYSWALI